MWPGAGQVSDLGILFQEPIQTTKDLPNPIWPDFSLAFRDGKIPRDQAGAADGDPLRLDRIWPISDKKGLVLPPFFKLSKDNQNKP